MCSIRSCGLSGDFVDLALLFADEGGDSNLLDNQTRLFKWVFFFSDKRLGGTQTVWLATLSQT